jgi:hypothetical protein
MSIRTHSLFHFTEELASVQGILSSGLFWPRYSLEDLSWTVTDKSTEDWQLAFPLVSFCDIPISRIEDHTEVYGEYGIGLTQDWGKSAGLNPLLYVNGKSPFAKELYRAAVTVFEKGEKKTIQPTAAEDGSVTPQGTAADTAAEQDWTSLYEALHLLSYTKPLTGEVRKASGGLTKNFYAESEWRYIPSAVMTTDQCYLSVEQFKNRKTRLAANEAVMEKGALAFTIGDIRYLFVKTISEIPLLVDFINSNLGQYPANQLKILLSRILSLEELRYDL